MTSGVRPDPAVCTRNYTHRWGDDQDQIEGPVRRPEPCWSTDRGLEIHQPSKGIQISHVQVAELAAGQITTVDAITIELVAADETPAVVIIRWRSKPTDLAVPESVADLLSTARRSPHWTNSQLFTVEAKRAHSRQGEGT